MGVTTEILTHRGTTSFTKFTVQKTVQMEKSLNQMVGRVSGRPMFALKTPAPGHTQARGLSGGGPMCVPPLTDLLVLLTKVQDVYMTVFCPKFWGSKKSLTQMKRYIDGRGKENIDMDDLFYLAASTYIHETLHHDVVSNPQSQ